MFDTLLQVGVYRFKVVRVWHGVDDPPPPSTQVKERIVLYLYLPSGPSWCVWDWTYFNPGGRTQRV